MSKALDRSATAGKYGGAGGRLHPLTVKKYQLWWGRFEAWCRRTGLTAIPASDETLAKFVEYLVQEVGYAPATARKVCDAVRWKHRMVGGAAAGNPVPDRWRAYVVLRFEEHIPPGFDPGRIRPACRDDLVLVAGTCDVGRWRDVRDMLAMVLVYAVGLDLAGLVALRVGQVHVDGDRVVVTLPNRVVVLDCVRWHDELGWACPVCLLRRWLGRLSEVDAADPRWLLLRSVDRHGNVGGGPRFAGRPGEGWTVHHARVAMRRRARAAQWDERVSRRPVTALRLGGARELRDAGAALAVVAAHAGYGEDSPTLARYLAVPEMGVT